VKVIPCLLLENESEREFYCSDSLHRPVNSLSIKLFKYADKLSTNSCKYRNITVRFTALCTQTEAIVRAERHLVTRWWMQSCVTQSDLNLIKSQSSCEQHHKRSVIVITRPAKTTN